MAAEDMSTSGGARSGFFIVLLREPRDVCEILRSPRDSFHGEDPLAREDIEEQTEFHASA